MARNRHCASEADLHPNTRFIDNPIFPVIEKNKKYQYYLQNHPLSWNDAPEVVNKIFEELVASQYYQLYMHKESVTFDDHKKMVIKIFVDIITQNDFFFQTLEDKSIFWNDDFELVFGIVYKTLKGIKAATTENSDIFYPIYNSEEDTEFAKTLLRKTILDYEKDMEIINKYTVNWEVERISDIDKLIMAAAISELMYFPSIPVKVTLDEFIEISKAYSSPKSSSFINGILDKIVLLLKENGQLNKSGRGLMEK
ncbi:transcription antitermination factor NusB [Odoribacter lunatus]|uniref:transcription antitermination factor NusB n=1 Tax=Odoribacter lunatus TaxID=2941335 RepID=UPI00203B7A19|nr:transcription antitermination factor NusB [Odoribacter lunatus]